MAADTLPVLTRRQLAEVFKDPRTLLAFENLQRQIAQEMPAEITEALNAAIAAQATADDAFAIAVDALAIANAAQPANPNLTAISALVVATFGLNLLTIATAADLRTVAGLGLLAVLDTIDDSNWSGTPLSVANGGTDATTPAGARTNLGVAIGSDVQAFSAALTVLAGKGLSGTGDLACVTNTTFAGTTTANILRTGAGSAATPAHSFTAATGSGMRHAGGGQVNFSAATVDVFGLYTGGMFVNAGLKLHVDGGGNSYLISPGSNQIDIYVAAQIAQHISTTGTRFDKPATFPPISAPSAPASGWTIYADTGTGELRTINAAGTVRTLALP